MTFLQHLGALGLQHCERLVFRHMRAKTVPSGILRFVTRHSHGNPLHLIELCRHLLAEQVVYVVNGECRYSSAEARTNIEASHGELKANLTYPRVLIQHARSRLDRLSPTMQMITKVASVLPRFFLVWHLLYVVENAGDDLTRSPPSSARHSPREYVLDVSGDMYRALEQLVLSGIFVVLKGDERTVPLGQDNISYFNAYELELPLAGDSVVTFNSPTIRSCASTLLLSAQTKHIQSLVARQFAEPE